MVYKLNSEKDVQSHVRRLKNFYGELSVFILVITVSLIIWLLCGGGYFWPLWIGLIWGVVLLLKASKLKIIAPTLYEGAHTLREKLPFIRPQWESEKAKEIMKKIGQNVSDMAKEELKPTKKSVKKQAVQRTATNKAAAKPKKIVKKSLTKKAASKKKKK